MNRLSPFYTIMSAALFAVSCSVSTVKQEPPAEPQKPVDESLPHMVKAPPKAEITAQSYPSENRARQKSSRAAGYAGGQVTRGGAIHAVLGCAADATFNTESYAPISENRYLSALDNPLSTFSIDVDRASYANARRFIVNGALPPQDAVRIEEFVNYFDYDYPDPTGPDPFSITTEIGVCPWKPGHRLVHIGIQGTRLDVSELAPANLVFLIDVSGSMNSANKLPLVKRAMTMLTENLRASDRIAVVVYAGAAGLALPSTPCSAKADILEALERLNAGGSTAGGEGISLAYQVASEHFIKGGNNRVILATDGDFNVGASSDGEMVRLIEKERERGVFLTVLGFGMGNYKDSKMESLADKGNGNYAYIDSDTEARKVLVKELGGTLMTIAKDVKVQVEFNPALVQAYRLVGYENRVLATEDFNDDRKDAGELGAGHSVTALYEIVPVGADSGLVAIDPLKYQSRAAGNVGGELCTVKFRYKQPDGTQSCLISRVVRDTVSDTPTDNYRFASAVAGFAMILRDSPHKGDMSYERVKAIAKNALGSDPEGYRRDFLRLVERAEHLASTSQRS